MKFKELSEADIELITKTYHDKENGPWEKRAASLGMHFNVSERTIRKWVSEKLKFKEKQDVEPEQYLIAKQRTHDTTKKIKFISWAQNNTPVHKKLLKKMEMYRDFHNADIHIIAGRYRNPTSIWTMNNKEEEFWHKEVLPYLDANRHDIHKYVSILSDIKVQPTAINPMSGLHSISGVNSCVIGAPKVQMEMIPVLEGQKPKMMLTTGAITKQNYTDGKAGKIGEFHHTFGFVIVEINDDETFHVRQVTADDKTGNFTDLFYKVDEFGVHRIDEIEAIVLGDIHYGNHDQTVLDSTMKMLEKIKPKHVILHDVFDGFSINHHEMKDPFIQYEKEVKGTNDLGKEVATMLDGLQAFEHFENVVIVRSNHDDFLDRWLKNEDWKKQPTCKNSRLYMHYSGMLLDQYASDSTIRGVIPAVINERFPKYITLGRNASYSVKGWELGQHGDEGSNGSRGSLLQFRKLNTKIIVGHYHSPGRKDGAIAVGTSTIMRMGYNRGASSWLQSHVIIHKDGRSQHINFINGEYTTLK
jgi:hypothetical protein